MITAEVISLFGVSTVVITAVLAETGSQDSASTIK